MKALRKPVYLTCGDYTVSLDTRRKEFNPKKERPGLEHYIAEAGKGALAQIPDPTAVDEGVVGNFMAARFNKQGHLGAMLSLVHPSLEYKPSTRVEGACCSGGLSLTTAIKSVLSEQSDVVLSLGVEVQNTVKAIYGADILAGAGHYAGERKNGHAYFFPSKFSDRAGAYKEKYGAEKTWAAMGRWYEQAIVNARMNPKAQEFHNTTEDLFATHQAMKPNEKSFCDHINVLDCSKVSDGGAAVLVVSQEGLARIGRPARREENTRRGGAGKRVDIIAPSRTYSDVEKETQLSSSPGQFPTPGPHQIRTRRFPPSGSSVDTSRGYGSQTRTVIRGRGRGSCRSKSSNRPHVKRLRWLRRHSHLYQARLVASTSNSRLRKLPLTPK